jgi:uncharacterized phage-associated protein
MMVDTRRIKATDLAKWFVQKGFDEPRNTFDGNMKLQKLLYFSQLVHLAKHGETLFEEPIYAFKNGSVIENVRQVYYHNNDWFISESYRFDEEFDPQVMQTLDLTLEIFGELSARELSDLNHQQFTWKTAYERSIDGLYNFHHKEESIIDIESIIEHDLEKVVDLISSYEVNVNEDNTFEVVNGVKFFYNPYQTIIDDNILKELESFALECEDSAYSFYIDNEMGLVIF